MNVLVTGGAGYIGSHTCVELLQAGHEVSVVDNLSNSKEEALNRIREVSGKSLTFYKIDLLDREGMENIFRQAQYDAVVHFAALKSPNESLQFPLRYYQNNVTGTLILCETMAKFGVKNIVFSSSATVYGETQNMPLREDFPCGPINPYGRTKWMMEMIISDLHVADPTWNAALLRYFNPVGAHPSGRIGEDPRGIPINLLPFITQVVVGRFPELKVFGDDYPTPDGTCIRDYIHVVDLAVGHLRALDWLAQNPGVEIFNLGTNRGSSVLEVVHAFENATGQSVPHRIVGRRAGDVAISYADASKANRLLNWRSERTMHEICTDAWRWQSANPNGYN